MHVSAVASDSTTCSHLEVARQAVELNLGHSRTKSEVIERPMPKSVRLFSPSDNSASYFSRTIYKLAYK